MPSMIHNGFVLREGTIGRGFVALGILVISASLLPRPATAQGAEEALAPIRVVVDSLVQTLPEGRHVLLTRPLSRSGFGEPRLQAAHARALARERGLQQWNPAVVCPPCIPEGARAAFSVSAPRLDSIGNTIVDVAVFTYHQGRDREWLNHYGTRYVLAWRDEHWVIVRAYNLFES